MAIIAQRKIMPWWLWPNLIGLDTPFVACVWLAYFSKLLNIPVTTSSYWILFTASWFIYLADRLVDTLKFSISEKSTSRHQFTATHFKALTILVIMVAITLAGLLFLFLSKALLIIGGLSFLAFVVYYALRYTCSFRLIPREIICGTLFTWGTVITLTPHMHWQKLIEFTPVFAFFSALASLACLLISTWETSADEASGDNSASTHYPKLSSILSGVIIILIFSSLIFMMSTKSMTLLPVATSACVYAIMHYYQKYWSKNSLRAMADGALLTPLIYWVFQ